MPFYTGDYLRDTRHLTPMKHGVYILLLAFCWDQKGPLPIDEQECAGIANCRSADEVDALRYVLKRFFILMDDGWYNKRIQLEIERAENISMNRSQAGKKGYQAKAKHLLSKSQASDSTPTPTPTTTPTPTSKLNLNISEGLDICRADKASPDVSPPNAKKESIKSFRAEALKVLEQLNRATGREYQPVPANIDMIVARLREGTTLRELRFVVSKKCHDWKDDEKMSQYLRPATLFNKTKFAQYRGEINFKEIDNVE